MTTPTKSCNISMITKHPDHFLATSSQVDRLLILNTPVAKGSKLRPELAAYKVRG